MSVDLKMFIFPVKRNRSTNTNKENIFFILGDPTRVWPCSYVFRDEKSGLCSSL